MKKEWIRPLTEVQLFVANEYVAACGDENKVYNFVCDAGGGTHGDVYQETNGLDGLQTRTTWVDGDGFFGGHFVSADTNLTPGSKYYHACGKTHEASTTDDFVNGYYVADRQTTPVIIWTNGGTNVHCTTNLDMSSWTTAKS